MCSVQVLTITNKKLNLYLMSFLFIYFFIALNVIVNCVCGPLARLGGTIARLCGGSAKKRSSFRSGDDLLSKMWNSVRSNNGIMILLNLLMVKAPITDADSIRALACKALCGLARSETVRQIIGKLPLFTVGQLQS